MYQSFLDHGLSYREPRVCMDLNCTFPFGNACAACKKYFDEQAISEGDDRSDGESEFKYSNSETVGHVAELKPLNLMECKEKAEKWLRRDAKRSKSNVDEQPNHRAFLQQRVLAQRSSTTTNSSKDSHSITVNPGRNAQLTKKARNKTAEQEPRTSSAGHQSSSPPELSSECAPAFSISRAQGIVAKSRPTSINTKLSTRVLDNAALIGEQRGRDKVFVGGAEAHHDQCPICLMPLGNPIFQHYLRCKYAHEEQARLDAMKKRMG